MSEPSCCQGRCRQMQESWDARVLKRIRADMKREEDTYRQWFRWGWEAAMAHMEGRRDGR